MQITVFGASGKVGSLVVEEALRRGHRVIAFVHSRDLFSPSGQLVVVKGDVYHETDVAKALRGSDAVISCLASWGTPKKNVLTAAMQAVIPAMRVQNMHRIITLTGTGATVPGKPLKPSQKLLLKLLQPFPAGKVFQDGIDHMDLLAASDLRWTTVRSPVMNNFGSKKYTLSMKSGLPAATINRAAVAASMLDQLESDDWVGKAPVIHRK